MMVSSDTFYMGKNTPTRQDFIIDNLKVELDEIKPESTIESLLG